MKVFVLTIFLSWLNFASEVRACEYLVPTNHCSPGELVEGLVCVTTYSCSTRQSDDLQIEFYSANPDEVYNPDVEQGWANSLNSIEGTDGVSTMSAGLKGLGSGFAGGISSREAASDAFEGEFRRGAAAVASTRNATRASATAAVRYSRRLPKISMNSIPKDVMPLLRAPTDDEQSFVICGERLNASQQTIQFYTGNRGGLQEIQNLGLARTVIFKGNFAGIIEGGPEIPNDRGYAGSYWATAKQELSDAISFHNKVTSRTLDRITSETDSLREETKCLLTEIKIDRDISKLTSAEIVHGANSQDTGFPEFKIDIASPHNRIQFARLLDHFGRNDQINAEAYAVDQYDTSALDPSEYEGEVRVIAANILSSRKMLLESRPDNPQGRRAKLIGLAALEIAQEELGSGNLAEASYLHSISVEMTDIALGSLPIVGAGKDLYEAISGRNLLTGELLTDRDRAFAIFGAATLGIGSKVKWVADILNKVASRAGRSIGLSRAIHLAKDYFHLARQKLWARHQTRESFGNAAEFERLKLHLEREEVSSLFDEFGFLKQSSLRNAELIKRGPELGNEPIKRRLTADGSHLGSWGKYRVPHKGRQFSYNVHFYYNRATNKQYIDADYKIKTRENPLNRIE